jgi:23S rRNA pseudouridine2604 synthase
VTQNVNYLAAGINNWFTGALTVVHDQQAADNRQPNWRRTLMSEQEVRLSKRMVELELCSRREADEYIEQGLVRVDGVVVRILGSRVLPTQLIELTRQTMALSDMSVTLLVHQPAQLSQTLSTLIKEETRCPDSHSGIVFSPRHRRQLTHCNQLDHGVSGLTVLTQDGRMAHKLAECEMEFLIAVDAAPATEALKQASKRLSMAGEPLAPFKISRQSDRQLRFVLHAPRPHQIEQMCQQLGVTVKSVHCIRIGRIALGKLPAGQWRYLLPTERF